MTTRVTLNKINGKLAEMGAKEQLFKGVDYFYFAEGESPTWPQTSVMTNRLGDLTLEQWIEEYNSLKAEANKFGVN